MEEPKNVGQYDPQQMLMMRFGKINKEDAEQHYVKYKEITLANLQWEIKPFSDA